MKNIIESSFFGVKKQLLFVLFLSFCAIEGQFPIANAQIQLLPLASRTDLLRTNIALSLNGVRSVASQCFQCHGTNGHSKTGIPTLNGLSDETLIQLISARKTNNDADDLMHKQAGAYTNAEIAVIASYISSLPKEASE
ncbi:MAG: c-type cytochrome [Cocleimonas sp.]|nr:c-type cytochrome [Cocleimonas sp.]